jgi:folate-binding protein YgfZ
LLAQPARALWRVTGPDRVRYVNGQVTNDVLHLPVGHTCYAAVTTAKGKMQGDVFIRAAEDALWIDAPVILREDLGARLGKYLIADDAEIEDVTEDFALTHLFGLEALNVQRLSNPRFGIPGMDGWTSLSEAMEGEIVDPTALEALRVELALAQWGVDMDENTLPPEAGLERHGISYDKGCYIGQETIARIKSIGQVAKSLQVLVAPDAAVPPIGSELHADGKSVGRITSTAWSPLLEKGIALGYVSRQHSDQGNVLEAAGISLKLIPAPRQLTV